MFPGRSILNVLVGDLESQGFFSQPTWRVCQPASQHQPTDVWLFAMVQASFPTLLNPATDRLVDTAECIKEHRELFELVKIFCQVEDSKDCKKFGKKHFFILLP